MKCLLIMVEATNIQTHLGLLPDLERVWISIDSTLLLWDYVDGYVIPYMLVEALLMGNA